MNDRLAALRLFARAARLGNFSSAGREVGLSQPSTSRLIAALEQDIGVCLFNRTTRAVSLTEAGAAYLLRVEAILASLDEADHEARGTGELRGILRVGTSASFALRMILPRIRPFLDKHPALKVELISNDGHADLVTEGLDIALRFGDLPISSAVVLKILEAPRILVAAPSYLQARGTPMVPSELSNHMMVVGPAYTSTSLSRLKDERDDAIRINSQLSLNFNEGALTAAVAGLGIVATSLHSVPDELEFGSLVRVLPEWDLGSMEVHVVFVGGKIIKPAARIFANFLHDEFLAQPWAKWPRPMPA
jgi:DNA-binding transcriptional LysR family regulator